RQRDADRVHTMMLRGVQHHAAPSAADVEQTHSRLEPELATDQLVLRVLRGFESDGWRRPHRARICERRAEQDPVEVVREVVVVRDRSRVARARVPPSVETSLLRWWRQWPDRRGADESHERSPLRRRETQTVEPAMQ